MPLSHLNLSHNQWFAIAVLVAILLRLAMMPFFAYTDLYSEYRRIHYASENLALYPGFNRLVIFYLELAYFTLIKWMLVNPEQLFYLADPARSEASVTELMIFAKDPYIFRHLFLLKLPYLLFDVLCAVMIWKYFEGHRAQKYALLIWLFNPVTLYATYYFGRFEVIGLFFLIATAFYLKNKRWLLAGLMFGLALNSREIYLLFLPAFALALIDWQQTGKQNLKQIAPVALIVLSLFLAPFLIKALFSLTPAFTQAGNHFQVSRGMSTFFSREFQGIYPFILVSCLCYFSLIYRRNLSSDGVFIMGGLSFILPYFMVGFSSAHYFTWALPFLILISFHQEKLKLAILVIITCWLLYWLCNDQLYQLTPISMVPIDESFLGRDNMASVIRSYFTSHPILNDVILKNIFRSIGLAAMAIVLIRIHTSRDKIS